MRRRQPERRTKESFLEINLGKIGILIIASLIYAVPMLLKWFAELSTEFGANYKPVFPFAASTYSAIINFMSLPFSLGKMIGGSGLGPIGVVLGSILALIFLYLISCFIYKYRRSDLTKFLIVVFLMLFLLTGFLGTQRKINMVEEAITRLSKQLTIKSLACDEDEIDVMIQNSGDKTVDVVPVNIIVKNYSTKKAIPELSLEESHAFSSSNPDLDRIANFTVPKGWDEVNIDLGEKKFEEGEIYTIEFEFPQDSLGSINSRCRAR